jgi:predicted ATPase
MNTEEIQKIREQHISNQWPQFLEEITIKGIHGFAGETIAFNFPVTVIVGENGSGKSTILKAAASCYDKDDSQKEYYPSRLFLETHWDKIHDVHFTYRIRRGDKKENFSITKLTKKWYYPEKKYTRPVYIFDVSRTLPLDATAGYAKVAKQAANEISTESLTEEYLIRLKHILGRDYNTSRFVVPDTDRSKKIGLLGFDNREISQFHQGAGEDTTQDLLMTLQNIPEYSLVLIDEVEASLHPRAQRRLVDFLLWLSRRKRIQIILTTHSSAIFEELPKEARILLLRNGTGKNVIYGVSSEFALTKVDDENRPALTLFVEDRESEIFLREIIRNHHEGTELLPLIHIQPVGPADVVQMLGKLSHDGKLPYKALAFVDGDYAPPGKGWYVLPGGDAPEKIVFQCFKDHKWAGLDERFGIGAGTLYNYLDDAITDPNHHKWTKHVGDNVKMGSSEVWTLLVNEWCKKYLKEAEQEALVAMMKEKIG